MARVLRRPHACLGIWTWAWLTWAVCVSVVLVGAIALVPTQIDVPRSAVYSGVLTSGGAPKAVTLPAGAVLETILVSSGDTVVAGQTVGTLDTDAMEAVLKQLQIDFLVARSVRRCYANWASESLPAPADLSGQEDQIAIAAGVDQCHLDFATRSDAAKLLVDRKEHLLERRQLIQRRFDLHMADPVPNDDQKARVAVDMMLARNGLDAELLTIEQMQSDTKAANESHRLSRIVELADDISRIVDLQARLVAQIRDPRLVAPDDGIVLHVRTPRGDSRTQDTDVIALRAEATAAPRLAIFVSRQDLTGMQEGGRVQVFAKGIPGWDMPIEGTLNVAERFIPDGIDTSQQPLGGLVAVPIELDEAVLDALKNLPVLNQAGGEAQAMVNVRMGDQSLGEVLDQELKNLPLGSASVNLQRVFAAWKSGWAL